MAKIKLHVPEQLRNVKYLDQITLELINYQEKFEPYLNVLKIYVEFYISSSIEEQVVNRMTEKDGIFELKVPIKRYWVNKTTLTPLPTPKELYDSVIFAVNSALQDFAGQNK